MPDRDNETISKKDIFNMMDSYKSSVEFNKELLESQVKILNQHESIINELKSISLNQSGTCGNIEKLINNLTVHNDNCSSNIHESVTIIKEVGSKINDHNIESIQTHNVIKNSIISGAGILSGIIGSLFYIIYQLIDKFEILKDIGKNLGI